MTLQEKLKLVDKLSAVMVEQQTNGFINAMRWRNLRLGRVKNITAIEEAYINLLIKHNERVKKLFPRNRGEKR